MSTEQFEQQLKDLQDQITKQHKILGILESAIAQVKTAVEKLQARTEEVHRKSVTTCEQCSIEFDVFAHHYSIGLFDNIVYVKCPRCNKAFPLDPKGGIKKE